MGGAGFPSLVVLSIELLCFASLFAEFSLLIVVYNIVVKSLRIELCSLYSITCCGCLFLAFSFTVTNLDGSFDVLLVWINLAQDRDRWRAVVKFLIN